MKAKRYRLNKMSTEIKKMNLMEIEQNGQKIPARRASDMSVDNLGLGEADLEEQSILLNETVEQSSRKRSLFHSPIILCILYSFCSISMTLSNKYILTVYEFDFNLFLLILQNGICVLLLLVARKLNWIEFEGLDRKKIINWIPLNILFVGMLLSGFTTINLLSVPMVTIFKNCTNILVTAGDFIFYKRRPSRGVVGALLLTLFGAIFAGKNDLEFNLQGYIAALINSCVTATYALYMPRAISDSNLSMFGRVYYNNLISLPLVFVVDNLVFYDINRFFKSEQSASATLILLILFSGCIGFFLSLCSFQCVQITSPTTYSMVGSTNKVPLAILGIFLFKTKVDSGSFIFISLSLLAGILFGYAKSKEKEQAKLKEKELAKLNQG